MNEDLNKMIDGYITDAEECIRLKDENQSKTYFKKMKAGMEKQKDWSYSLLFTYPSKSRNGSYLDELPKLIEALKSYKIARQNELEQMYITGQPPQTAISISTHNNQQQLQMQQQFMAVSFDQAISWVQNNDSLGAAETAEILAEIKKIQTIAESPELKKTKWEMMKPFLLWLGNKGVDLAIQVLPLILMAVK